MILTRIWPPVLVAAAFAIPALVLAPAYRAPLDGVAIAKPAVVKPTPPIAAPAPMAFDDIEGCLLEYSERGYGDAKLVIRTSIGRTGRVFGIVTYESPDAPMLRMCIEEALQRTTHERRVEDSTFDVIVRWENRVLGVEVRVLHGWHRVPGENGMHVSDFYEDNLYAFENALPAVANCFRGDDHVTFRMVLGETATAIEGAGPAEVRACVIGAFLRNYTTDRERSIEVTASKDWVAMQEHETDAPDIQWRRAR